MTTFREAITSSVSNFLCEAAATTDPFRNWVENATSSVPGVGFAAGLVDGAGDLAASAVCPSPASPITSPPVYPPENPTPTGCNATTYRTRVIYTRFVGGVEETVNDLDNNTYLGPVSETIITPTNPDNAVTTTFTVEVTFASGTFTIVSNPFTDTGTTATVQSVTFERTDGQPDNCGEPPGGRQPPPTGGDEITYDGPDGPVIDEPINFFPDFPRFLPDGGLTIPFRVDLPDFSINLDYDLSTGDITFNFGGEPGASDCCPPVEEVEDEAEEDDPPEPDSDRRLWGIKVNCVVGPESQATELLAAGSTESLFLPDLGLVRFAVEYGGVRAWTEPQRIQTLSQFLPVNVPATAYAYDIALRAGVTVAVKEVIVKGSDETFLM